MRFNRDCVADERSHWRFSWRFMATQKPPANAKHERHSVNGALSKWRLCGVAIQKIADILSSKLFPNLIPSHALKRWNTSQ